MADTSIRSNVTILSRAARPESGRLRRKYPYRWLFDQVHVKSLIFHVEVALLAAAMIGLYRASQMNSYQSSELLSIPGFDGLPWVEEGLVGADGSVRRPHFSFARNALNLSSYFLIFSVLSGLLGMRLSETNANRRNFPEQMNPALLLIPSAISVTSILFPLILWTLRTMHLTIKILSKGNLKPSIVFDACRLSLLPIIIIWTVYVYFLYGFWLGLLYYQRRGDHQSSPNSINSPFRRPLRKPSLRFQGKATSSNLPDLTSVLNEPSGGAASSHCAPITTTSTPSRHNRSVSPRGFRHLETVDEEAQSRSSSD